MDDVRAKRRTCGVRTRIGQRSTNFRDGIIDVSCAAAGIIVTVFAVAIAIGPSPVLAWCPARCQCNDESLQALCVSAALDVVPIQLNPGIKNLNLSHNKINNIDYTLKIYNLVTLDLSYNKIQTLGSLNFESQHYLKVLNLSNNYVKSISRDAFRGLRNLQILDLSYNEVTDIAANTFNEMRKLEVLLLNNNNITSFEPDLSKHLSNVHTLFLNDNQLLEMPTDLLLHMNELRELRLAYNLIESIGEGAFPSMPNMKYLSLDSNIIGEIDDGTFDELPALQYLDLSDNNLTFVPTSQLSKLTNLTVLKLSGNFIMKIDALAFRSLFQLKYLCLSRLDRLRKIDSRAFVDNINLEKIRLDSNRQLDELPNRVFYNSMKLSHISARNCALQQLDASHFPLDQLSSLRLAGNPFVCNCSLLWLWKLTREQSNDNGANRSAVDDFDHHRDHDEEDVSPFFTLDADSIECAGPETLVGSLLINVRESAIGCSSEWTFAIATVATGFVCIAVLASIVAYMGWLRCLPKSRSETTSRSSRMCHNVPHMPAIGCPNSSAGFVYVAQQPHHHQVHHHHHLPHHSHTHHPHHQQYNDSNPDKSIPADDYNASKHEYHTLAPWNITYRESNVNANSKQKPHIVYV